MSEPREVAVVGMAGRFPGARNVAEFWSNLCAGTESIVFFDDDELAAAGVDPAIAAAPGYVRAGAVLADIDKFDADFFGYTPREAQIMDPQHRLFLETAWHALEHSGHDAAQYPGSVGVFGGAGSNGYLGHVYSNPEIVEAVGRTRILLGNEINFLTSRTSYKIGLRGPSISMRTACSTSLVAVHTAMRSLRSGECDLALAGGAFINTEQSQGYQHQEGSFLSPDGHCRPFDASARGTVFGSGVGVVVLKRLSEAVAEGDTIYAVIKGSAVNNDGAVKVGFTAPSVTGQAEVIVDALADAGVPADSITYIEAHGTGTILGDPIEVQALTRAFRESTGRSGFCGVGSVKSNIGHLDAAAGIAGLLKAVLALHHGVIPATLNFSVSNPDIDFPATPFLVRDRLGPWPDGGGVPRRAGVSAFGFGGTNAHVVLEEAPAAVPSGPGRASELVVLSARTSGELELVTDGVAAGLREQGAVPLADAAYTLAVGRRALPFRRVVAAADPAAAAAMLESRDPAEVADGHAVTDNPSLAFAYTGQGSQFPGMGRELYDSEPVYREAVDECAELLASQLEGLDIRAVLYPDGDAGEHLQATEFAQPALFVTEFALTRLWESWGLRPAVVLGHSLGQYVAATVAGVFELGDALRLVALRGRLMQAQPPGAMVNVIADRETVTGLLGPGLSLAAHNSPRDCVVSGSAAAVEAFAEAAQGRGLVTHPVPGSSGFHSELMAPMVEEFTKAVATAVLHPPVIPVICDASGERLTDDRATDPYHWGQHVVGTIEFAAAVTTLTQLAGTVLEVGPGQTLTSLIRRTTASLTTTSLTTASLAVSSLPHPRDRRPAAQAIARTLGQLWTQGHPVDWRAYYQHQTRRRTPQPGYPFQPQTHWLHPRPTLAPAAPTARSADLADWFYVPTWQRDTAPPLRPADHGDHRWLIFADELGLGRALAQRLRASGGEVTVVTCGEAAGHDEPGHDDPGHDDPDTFALDPADGSRYEQLLARMADGTGLPDRVVHCWGVTGDDAADDTLLRRRGFDSLVWLSRAWGQSPAGGGAWLWVVSDGVHCVTGDERLSPAKASALGPCRVIPREQPALRCRSVDLALGPSSLDRTADQLMAEFTVAPEIESVAYRGAYRWTQVFTPRPMSAATSGTPISALRDGGTYVVTGGLGGLGLALAERIARAGGRTLLIGRTPLPPEETWDSPSPSASPRLRESLRRLAALRRSGAQFMVAIADVGDREALSAAIRAGEQRWGTIHGAFHAAGVAGGGLIQVKGATSADEVFRSKVDGTVLLHEILAPREPDFLVLFGSNAANLGSVGQVDYCAANCFVDAFAQAHSDRRVIAIDWGPWQSIGMSVSTRLPGRLRELREVDLAAHGMTPAQGLEALDRVLGQLSGPQVVVSPTALPALFASAISLDAIDQLGALNPSAAAPAQPRPELATGYVPPSTDLERDLCAIWQGLLGVDRIGAHDSIFELGGDSLIAIQLVATISRRWPEAGLTVAQVYEALTVSRLAAKLEPPVDVGRSTEQLIADRRDKVQRRRQHQQRRNAERRK